MLFEILCACVLLYIVYIAAIRVQKFAEYRKKIDKLPRFSDKSLKKMLEIALARRENKTFLPSVKDMFIDEIKTTKHSGKFFLVHSSIQTFLFITDPEAAQAILRSPVHVQKAGVLDLWRDWLGDSLAFSCVEKWRRRRRLLTHAFHFDILEQFIEGMNEQSTVFVNKLHSLVANNEPIDIHNLFGALALDIMCVTSMGVKINAQLSKNHEYVEAVTK